MTSQSSASSLTKQRQSWLDLVSQAAPSGAGDTAIVCSVQVHSHQSPQEEAEESHDTQAPESSSQLDSAETGSNDEEPQVEEEEEEAAQQITSNAQEEGVCPSSSDEMEKLYIHLKEASLSPIGDRKPSTKREFRASFIKRCKNQTVNDRLHRIRTLNSTLKSKEADLQAIEQVLSDTQLTSDKFREWKEANGPLVQEICLTQDQQVAPEATRPAASVIAAPVVETSL